MTPVINPDIILELCSTSKKISEPAVAKKEDPMPEKSSWEIFKARAKEVWGIAKPVIDTAVAVISVVTGVLNAFSGLFGRKNFGRKMRRAFA